MDLSGSMQGAGGVGGLLMVTDHGSPSTDHFYPTYDGNGNVSEYLDDNGTAQAHYEYDAFGNITVSSGTKAADFAHRFSTKPLDGETGLYYYGYRYYDATVGRWISRDPIGEQGGLNLYGFVDNDGMNRWDVLGLKSEKYAIKVQIRVGDKNGVSQDTVESHKAFGDERGKLKLHNKIEGVKHNGVYDEVNATLTSEATFGNLNRSWVVKINATIDDSGSISTYNPGYAEWLRNNFWAPFGERPPLNNGEGWEENIGIAGELKKYSAGDNSWVVCVWKTSAVYSEKAENVRLNNKREVGITAVPNPTWTNSHSGVLMTGDNKVDWNQSNTQKWDGGDLQAKSKVFYIKLKCTSKK